MQRNLIIYTVTLALLTILVALATAGPFNFGPAKANIALLVSPKHNGSGTGWQLVYRGKRATITNAHVCATAEKEGWMWAIRGEEREKLKIMGTDVWRDLCLLTAMSDANGYSLASRVVLYEEYHAFGHPLGNPLTPEKGILVGEETIKLLYEVKDLKDCKGKHLHLEEFEFWGVTYQECLRSQTTYYTTLNLYPGSSGSPLLNSVEEVVGVICATQMKSDYSYAVTLKDLKAFLKAHIR
jgi:hypothetical protein